MGRRQSALVFAAFGVAAQAATQHESSSANPIRKVVNMLQAMQKRVQDEGVKEKEMYDKFMCYCQTNGGDLKATIQAATDKVPVVTADIQAKTERLSQTKDTMKQAQTDRSDAQAAMKEATAIREKEAAAFAAEKAEYDTNIHAIANAVTALEKGMAGSFVQTADAKVLKQLAASKQDSIVEEDRQDLLSFLDGTQRYAPSSGQITGILKQLGDEMAAGLAAATATEEAAIKSYEALMVAKKKEVGVLSGSIETKMERAGELGVEIEQIKGDLENTQEALAADKDFLANLDKSCATKTAEWEEIVKTRADELTTLAETIKVLNDDDALDLFKKTLPSASSSFVQMQTTSHALRSRAAALLQKVGGGRPDQARLNLIALALSGKKVGFAKVVKMIDEMVETLNTEQNDDDHKKEYCNNQLDLTDDKKKGLERSIADSEAAIEDAKEGIAATKEEIAALQAGIKALDKSVAEATEQRKEENAEYKDLMASNSAAKDLMNFAKNRLNKFYQPKLYRPPPKKELSSEDRIFVNMGGTPPPTEAPGGIAGTGIGLFAQVSAHSHRAAPPPPPETFGAYTKKTEENTGVIAMMDLLIKDLDKEMTEAETSEKKSQTDYETAMKDAASKRTQDTKSLTQKESTQAALEGDLESHTDAKRSTTRELAATLKYIQSLHSECDWLLQYFDVRKDARASEIDALQKAKAVLKGADYAFVQTAGRGFLRGTA